MKSQKLKVVMVGFGRQAREEHFPALKLNPHAEVVAVVDPIVDQQGLGVSVYKSLDELSRTNIEFEAGVVCVPHNLHFQVTAQLLSMGKHVFKEKPAALKVQELQELVKIATKHKVKLLVNAQRRLMPHYEVAKNRLLPRVGRPFYISGKYTLYVPNPEEGWRGQLLQAGGGCVIDMGYHLLDLLIYFCGLPSKLTAVSSARAIRNYHYDAEDTASLLIQYDHGELKANGALLISRYMGPKDEYLNIVGDEGTLAITKEYVALTKNDGTVIDKIERSEFIHPMDHFIDTILTQNDSTLEACSHLDNMKLIDACYKSITLEIPVNID